MAHVKLVNNNSVWGHFDLKFPQHDINKLKMPETAKKKRVKKKTRPEIKRSHKHNSYASRPIIEKEPFHKSCEM